MNSQAIHLDFETRSACDIREAGAEVYARHPSTDVWCLAWAFEDAECISLVRREDIISGYIPPLLRAHIESGGIVYAHNAPFELAIWNNVTAPRYGWPPLSPLQTRCTAAMAYAMALPGSLDNASRALGLEQEKDQAGYRLMLQLARPRRVEPNGDIVWWEDADKLERLYDYCRQDVVVERELHRRMMELSDAEQEVWQLDYAINQRGVPIDRPAVVAAIAVVEHERKRMDAIMRGLTGGAVEACTEVGKLTTWVKAHGVDTDGLAKADIADLLEDENLPAHVRAALLLRREAGKSSTAKLQKMLACVCDDGRVRGALQYHGASTGRWAGRLIQPQNVSKPREWSKDPARQKAIIGHMFEILLSGLSVQEMAATLDCYYGPTMDAVVDCMRGFIAAPPGFDLIAVDFSAIEARVLAWLAGEEEPLSIFRAGGDIYLHAASGIYRRPISKADKQERQIGKVAVLALGYQGGVGAFQTMARTYGVKVSDEEAEAIKTAWRTANPAIVQFWYDCEDAARTALLSAGRTTTAGSQGREIRFKLNGSFLWCKLPSGRVICYPFPRVEEVPTPWGSTREAVTHMTVNSVTKKWERTSTYGGKLVENIVQAVSRDLLASAMLRLEAHGYPLVMTVHDELVMEVPEDEGSLEEVEELAAVTPEWAAGLPMKAEGWRNKRYMK